MRGRSRTEGKPRSGGRASSRCDVLASSATWQGHVDTLETRTAKEYVVAQNKGEGDTDDGGE